MILPVKLANDGSATVAAKKIDNAGIFSITVICVSEIVQDVLDYGEFFVLASWTVSLYVHGFYPPGFWDSRSVETGLWILGL